MAHRNDRAQICRWHLRQHRLHSHKNHGRQRSRRLHGQSRRIFRHPRPGHWRQHARIIERKNEIVLQARNNNEKAMLSTKNLDLIYGAARFTGPRSISVKKNDGEEINLTADKIFIDTGMRPALPSIDGFDQLQSLPNILDNASIMELDRLPDHLLVLGGGYIGLEFGQMFRRFGSRVTIIQAGAQLLSHEDTDIIDEVTKILREDGIDVLLNAKTQAHPRRQK